MMIRLLPVLAFLAFASVPLVLGNAESAPDAKTEAKAEAKTEGKTEAKTDAKTDPKAEGKDGKSEVKEAKAEEKDMEYESNECLASEELIHDLEGREKKMKEREKALQEKEKEIAAQEAAVKESLAKLEATRAEVQGAHAKQMAERDEKVNKLIETFETMSPKSAAAVINGVDDELAVTALSRLSTSKAGKIMGALSPDKSSKLSELMAFGTTTNTGKEKERGESTERTPASKR